MKISGFRFAVTALAVLASCDEAVLAEIGDATVAELACINRLNTVAGRSDATVNDLTTLEDGYSVLLDLPGAAQPWACTTDFDGNILELFYLGEG